MHGSNVPATRAEDLRRIRAALDDPGRPATVTIEGQAGLGKSTLFDATLAAVGPRYGAILQSRPVASELTLAFAGLADLLRGLPAQPFQRLAPPRLEALEVALGRRDAPVGGIEQLVLSLGLLDLLRDVASEHPILIAIDDFQWLDPSTATLLDFVGRRLDVAPVSLITTWRTEPGVAPPREPVGIGERVLVVLGPLTTDELDGVLRGHGIELARPTVQRVRDATDGNPFYALHLGESLVRSGRPPEPGRPLRLPGSLRDLVRLRLANLSEPAFEVAVVVSALARPRRSLIERVVGDPARATQGADEAERSGILRSDDGTYAFSHPILATVAYESLTEVGRERLHRRLADLVESPEERAIHLALATSDPDLVVADTLGDAADVARGRGALGASAELAEHALRLTPPDDHERRVRFARIAATGHLATGDARRARELLAGAIETTPTGRARNALLAHLGHVICGIGEYRNGIEVLEEVLGQPELEPDLRAIVHTELTVMRLCVGELAAALDHGREATSAAEQAQDEALLFGALDVYAKAGFQLGVDGALDMASRATELQERVVGPLGDAAGDEALLLIWADRLEEARSTSERVLQAAIDAGDMLTRCDSLMSLSELDFRAGDWQRAHARAEEAVLLARTCGVGLAGFERVRAQAAVGLGDLGAAERLAERHLATGYATGHVWVVMNVYRVQGFAALSAGRNADAAAVLLKAYGICQGAGVQEPGILRLEGDLIEALVSIGDLGQAEHVVTTLEDQGRRRERAWAIAVAARGRAMLASARGQAAEGQAAISRAEAALPHLGQAFESGRTMLAVGTIHRRANRRRDARRALEAAIERFEEVGAPLWLERARAELARIGGRPARGLDLTPTERQVAEAVAGGQSNREVAARLFMTVRTVESNLTRIYQKLGLSSRSQLARRLPEATEAGEPRTPAAPVPAIVDGVRNDLSIARDGG